MLALKLKFLIIEANFYLIEMYAEGMENGKHNMIQIIKEIII